MIHMENTTAAINTLIEALKIVLGRFDLDVDHLHGDANDTPAITIERVGTDVDGPWIMIEHQGGDDWTLSSFRQLDGKVAEKLDATGPEFVAGQALRMARELGIA